MSDKHVKTAAMLGGFIQATCTTCGWSVLAKGVTAILLVNNHERAHTPKDTP